MKQHFGICEWSLPVSGPLAMQLAKEAGYEGMQLGEAGGRNMAYPLNHKRVQEIYRETAGHLGLQLHSLNLGALLAEGTLAYASGTEQGNFEGKSIPNLLNSDPVNSSFEACLPKLREYRKQRYALHRDEKILTSWNGLMIAALCALYLLSRDTRYLDAAKRADAFVETHLYDGDALFVSFHGQKRGVLGFLDDYAACIYAQLALYKATLEEKYLSWAKVLCDQAVSDFADGTEGFYLYSDRHEELILRPKGTYDGAIPSGNSLMSCNLVRLSILTGEEKYRTAAENQLDFLSKTAAQYPTGYAMFLTASLEYTIPPMQVTVVPDPQTDIGQLPLTLPPDTVIRLVEEPTEEYKLLNGKTTYYVCKGQSCQPPTNDLGHISR